jgi:hypothetical protein
MKLGHDGRYDNAKRYLSSAFLSSLVGLPLTLTLGRLPPSLSPGVLWYSTRLAPTLLLLARHRRPWPSGRSGFGIKVLISPGGPG